jgi:hypothetical protein
MIWCSGAEYRFTFSLNFLYYCRATSNKDSFFCLDFLARRFLRKGFKMNYELILKGRVNQGAVPAP